MQLGPGQDQVLLATGHRAGQQGRWVNGKTGPILAEARVKVRALMHASFVVHRNDDTYRSEIPQASSHNSLLKATSQCVDHLNE
jgi:hypothetical protein